MTEFIDTPLSEPTSTGQRPTPAPDDGQQPTSAPGTEPRLMQVDPRTLVVEANVRTQARLTSQFVASIREHGVLEPVVAYTDPTGALRVRMGQRRTLAAIEADRATIPALVYDADPDEVRRIVHQVTENDHRDSLTDAERTGAYQQLSLLGMPAANIAKTLHTTRAQVQAGLAVATSTIAAAAIARYDLTLDQGLVIAEFDGEPEAVKELTVTAVKRPEQFAHTAQRLRDQRTEREQITALTDDLTAHGVRVIDRPAHDDKKVTDLDRLTKPGTDGKALTPAKHKACPGHAACVARSWQGPRVVYVCTDWKANGHADRFTSSTLAVSGPMSEQQKAQRREVVANNKAWKSATTVRREFLATFAARRTPPTGTPVFLAHALAQHSFAVQQAATGGHALARQVLALPEGTTLTDAISAASPARANQIAVVLVLAAMEDATSVATWRNPTGHDRAYLSALASWGYALADVERLVIDGPTATASTSPEAPDTTATSQDTVEAPEVDEPEQVEPEPTEPDDETEPDPAEFDSAEPDEGTSDEGESDDQPDEGTDPADA
ncbi:MAG TPA: ParB N-terminal domain-containing protein [Friedmanniella sp.]